MAYLLASKEQINNIKKVTFSENVNSGKINGASKTQQVKVVTCE